MKQLYGKSADNGGTAASSLASQRELKKVDATESASFASHCSNGTWGDNEWERREAFLWWHFEMPISLIMAPCCLLGLVREDTGSGACFTEASR